MTESVLVVGTGLLGTSIGLALADSRRVLLTDRDAARVQTAVRRGAGELWWADDLAGGGSRSSEGVVDLAVIAVPPSRTAGVIRQLQERRIARSYTHVAGVQSQVQRELEAGGGDVTDICGGHPLAGRERSGPAAATAALFEGRPWLICPGSQTSGQARGAVEALALACGAHPVRMPAAEHDRTVALISHLPQVTASALAARLLSAGSSVAGLAGPGLQDTTRIAASDPDLWLDLLTANAAEVAPLVRAVGDELAALAGALQLLASGPDAAATLAVRDLLIRGNQGRALVPVKRGGRDQDYALVCVSVSDRPGQLAGLFACASRAEVNIEDVRVEHLPGRPTGVVELLVRDRAAAALRSALEAAGYALLESPDP